MFGHTHLIDRRYLPKDLTIDSPNRDNDIVYPTTLEPNVNGINDIIPSNPTNTTTHGYDALSQVVRDPNSRLFFLL